MLEINYDPRKEDLINRKSAFVIGILGPKEYHCFAVNRNKEKERILFQGLEKIKTPLGFARLDMWAREGMKIPEKISEFNPISLDIEKEKYGIREPRKIWTSVTIDDVERVYVKNLSGVKAEFVITVCYHERPVRMKAPIAKDGCFIIDQGDIFLSLDNKRLDEREEAK